jgi:hypothetical protein
LRPAVFAVVAGKVSVEHPTGTEYEPVLVARVVAAFLIREIG